MLHAPTAELDSPLELRAAAPKSIGHGSCESPDSRCWRGGHRARTLRRNVLDRRSRRYALLFAVVQLHSEMDFGQSATTQSYDTREVEKVHRAPFNFILLLECVAYGRSCKTLVKVFRLEAVEEEVYVTFGDSLC